MSGARQKEPHQGSGPRSAPRAWRHALEWLAGKPEPETPEVRRALLLTMLESPMLLVMACLWSQIVGLAAFAITRAPWALAWLIVDATLQGSRVLLHWQHPKAIARRARPPYAALLAVNIVWILTMAIGIVAALTIEDIRTTVLSSFVGIGFSGFVVSRYAAFPRFATLLLSLLTGGLTLGLIFSPWPTLWTIGLTVPGATLAFRILMRQNHAVLLGALRAQQENRRLSMHDPLTGLGNRLLLRARLARMVRRLDADRPDTGFSVLCLDLDGFKEVNDRHGHAGGDWLLKSVTRRLQRVVRPQDLVSRIGGDEFVLLIENAQAQAAIDVAERVIAEVSRPHDLGGSASVYVGVSVGIAVAPIHGILPDQLLAHADGALYSVKRSGRGAWRMDAGDESSKHPQADKVMFLNTTPALEGFGAADSDIAPF